MLRIIATEYLYLIADYYYIDTLYPDEYPVNLDDIAIITEKRAAAIFAFCVMATPAFNTELTDGLEVDW